MVVIVLGVILIVAGIGLWSITEKRYSGTFPYIYERTIHTYEKEAKVIGVIGGVVIVMGIAIVEHYNRSKTELMKQLQGQESIEPPLGGIMGYIERKRKQNKK